MLSSPQGVYECLFEFLISCQKVHRVVLLHREVRLLVTFPKVKIDKLFLVDRRIPKSLPFWCVHLIFSGPILSLTYEATDAVAVHDLFTILLECEIISNVVMQKIDYFSESPFIYRCFVTFSKINFYTYQANKIWNML